MNMKKTIFTALTCASLITTAQELPPSHPYSVKVVTGDAIKELIPFIVTECIIAFSGYPYLYVSNVTEQEQMSDLAAFAQQPDNAVAIAYYGETPIGLLKGCPLPHVFRHFKEPSSIFDEEDIATNCCYFFDDITILAEHRGKKLTGKLFDVLEEHARKLGYTQGAFITESHESHPLKPTSYQPLEPLWNKLNYKKTPLKLHSDWHTYQPDGSVKYQEHTLHFWTKMLH